MTTEAAATSSFDPLLERGKIMIYRVFDVGDEIDLKSGEKLLPEANRESALRTQAGYSPSIVVRNAALRRGLGESVLRIGKLELKADALATVWDYGSVSICFQIDVSGMRWSQLNTLAGLLNEDARTAQVIDSLAQERSHRVVDSLASAIKNRNLSGVSEDYIIYQLEKVEGLTEARELLDRLDLPRLILGETQEALSSRAKDGILQNLYQYSTRDFVLIDWNSAIILEPSGSRQLADVLEFALTHLLEFRYYDDLLDHKLADLYDAIEERRQSTWRGRYGRLARDANSKFIEFSEFIERVENSLKVVGDFYLAVIFRAAIRRFRIPDWQQSITRKLNLLARVSELLQGESNTRRSHWLEVIIIALIAFEIISAMVKSGG
jgi:hypothetical protein